MAFRPVKIAPPIQVRQSSVKPISSTLGGHFVGARPQTTNSLSGANGREPAAIASNAARERAARTRAQEEDQLQSNSGHLADTPTSNCHFRRAATVAPPPEGGLVRISCQSPLLALSWLVEPDAAPPVHAGPSASPALCRGCALSAQSKPVRATACVSRQRKQRDCKTHSSWLQEQDARTWRRPEEGGLDPLVRVIDGGEEHVNGGHPSRGPLRSSFLYQAGMLRWQV